MELSHTQVLTAKLLVITSDSSQYESVLFESHVADFLDFVGWIFGCWHLVVDRNMEIQGWHHAPSALHFGCHCHFLFGLLYQRSGLLCVQQHRKNLYPLKPFCDYLLP